jgi:hypothetical protein
MPLDVFVLRWTGLAVESQLALPLVRMTCEIFYSTAGTQAISGLDRGRAIEAMDAELLQMLSPALIQKMNYATTPATAMQTSIFWEQPEFGLVAPLRDQLSRVATVMVWSWQEAGEK